MQGLFDHDLYVIRKKVLKLMGGAFHIYDRNGGLLFYSKQKAFKLKEDIRLYTGEDMQHEVLTIKARQVIDFSAGYEVVDATLGQRVGGLRRRGLKSLLRDTWIVLDANDQEIATIQEDSTAAALVRRFFDMAALILPQKYHLERNGQTLVTYQQNYNPIVKRITIDFGFDNQRQIDRRLGLAAGVLLSAIEGRQG